MGALPMSEIERALIAHPDVTNAVFSIERTHDGRRFTIAFVAINPDRLIAEKAKRLQAETDRRVGQWRRAFDQAYRGDAGGHAPSFVGWTSNFTNRPIPEADMADWLDHTIRQIRALGARRVLEIGCGVGLLLEKLAPACETYCGTDLSPVAVDRLRTFAQSRPELRHVEFLEREATDLSGLSPCSFDAVVLNSVVQYFPGIEYLHAVLERAVELLAPGGHIFVGDVRNLQLLPVFHREVQAAKVSPGAMDASLERKVFLSIAQERELVIDPGYFQGISESIPRISGAEILQKRGSSYELTRYRYDVVLRVDHPAASTCSEDHGLVPAMKHWADRSRPLATDPMAAALLQHLGLELGTMLRTRFPELELPAAVIALNQRDFAEFAPSLSLALNDRGNHEAGETAI